MKTSNVGFGMGFVKVNSYTTNPGKSKTYWQNTEHITSVRDSVDGAGVAIYSEGRSISDGRVIGKTTKKVVDKILEADQYGTKIDLTV